MQDKVMDWTQACDTIAKAQSSHAPCDLDLQTSNTILAQDILSCHDDHLCQIIF